MYRLQKGPLHWHLPVLPHSSHTKYLNTIQNLIYEFLIPNGVNLLSNYRRKHDEIEGTTCSRFGDGSVTVSVTVALLKTSLIPRELADRRPAGRAARHAFISTEAAVDGIQFHPSLSEPEKITRSCDRISIHFKLDFITNYLHLALTALCLSFYSCIPNAHICLMLALCQPDA